MSLRAGSGAELFCEFLRVHFPQIIYSPVRTISGGAVLLICPAAVREDESASANASDCRPCDCFLESRNDFLRRPRAMKTFAPRAARFSAAVMIWETGKCLPISARAVHFNRSSSSCFAGRVRSCRSLLRAASPSARYLRDSASRVATGIAENLAERIGTRGWTLLIFVTRIRGSLPGGGALARALRRV